MLDDLVGAGMTVFARQGFRDAQMADVAREAGVALGTLYSYVESKDALFGLIVDRALGERPDAQVPVPVPTPDTAELLRQTGRKIEQLTTLPVLAAAISRRRPRDMKGQLWSVLDELWDLIHETRLAADVIERSARDWPELAQLFFRGARADVHARVNAYFERGTRLGHFRATPEPALIARTTIETITFWARHRYGDLADAGPPDADVRPIILAFLVDGILADDLP